MQNTPVRSGFGEITDFLATNPTPEEINVYRLPADLQARAHELLELNGEGELTNADREETLDFVRVDEMLSLLKDKMKKAFECPSVKHTPSPCDKTLRQLMVFCRISDKGCFSPLHGLES